MRWRFDRRVSGLCAVMVLAAGVGSGCGRGASTPPPAAAAQREATPAATAEATPDPSPDEDEATHGELLTVEGQRVLRLSGTPAQMGRAHGRLLRAEILEIVDGYALDVIPPATLETASVLYDQVAQVPPRLREEAEGIVEGMKAAGGAEVPRLGRELRASDLLVLNAMTDLLAIGCSSVSAWGGATEGDAALAGAPAMVRNLDWSEDPQLLGNQLVIVYRPEDPQRQAVVSVAFAGYIGCLSCMNEAGVAALFNMGYGDGAAGPAQALGGFAPANLLLRDTLERRDIDGDGRSTADDVQARWQEATHAGSYILHLIEPRREGTPAPARVLEVEADGVVVREPDDAGLGPQLLAATNHLRAKEGPQQCSRYAHVQQVARERERRFDTAQLWQLGTEIRLPQVVHAVLVQPEARRVRVWLRAPGASADDPGPPVIHEWSALLGEPAAPR